MKSDGRSSSGSIRQGWNTTEIAATVAMSQAAPRVRDSLATVKSASTKGQNTWLIPCMTTAMRATTKGERRRRTINTERPTLMANASHRASIIPRFGVNISSTVPSASTTAAGSMSALVRRHRPA